MRRGAAIGIGVAALVAVAGGAAWWALTRPSPFETAVDAAVVMLMSGDRDAAAALVVGGGLDAAQEQTLLDAFAVAADHLEDAEATGLDEATGTVAVSGSLAGDAVELDLRLRETPAGYRLDPAAFPRIRVTMTLGDTASIGGTSATVGDAVAVLPALYAVVPEPVGILSGVQEKAVVTGTNTVALTPEIATEAAARAEAELAGYLSDCTAPATVVPAHCGIRVPWGADFTALTGLVFQVERLPSVTFSPDQRAFTAAGGDLVAVATGTPRPGGSPTVTYRDADWTLRGTVSFDGGTLRLAVG